MFEVILYQPEIPPNTGHISRLCANTGSRLHLVKPLGFNLEQRELRRAGLDYSDLAQVTLHDTLDACLATLSTASLSAVSPGMSLPTPARLFAIETGSAHCYASAKFQPGDALLFGAETRGLPPEVLARVPVGHTLSILMRLGNRSLNLSNAVALVVYEAWRQQQFALTE